MPRFVLLEHDHPQLHWDFMLEADAALLTWRLDRVPSDAGDYAVLRLPDHRLKYLDYEGPVSGNRGCVKRVDAGIFAWLPGSATEFIVEVRGSKLRGIARLRDDDAKMEWTPITQ